MNMWTVQTVRFEEDDPSREEDLKAMIIIQNISDLIYSEDEVQKKTLMKSRLNQKVLMMKV